MHIDKYYVCPEPDWHYPLGPLRVLTAFNWILLGLVVGGVIQRACGVIP